MAEQAPQYILREESALSPISADEKGHGEPAPKLPDGTLPKSYYADLCTWFINDPFQILTLQ